MKRPLVLVASGLAIATTATMAPPADADDNPPAPIVMTVMSSKRVHVQLSEGRHQPCDSRDNRMLVDGWMGPTDVFRGTTREECVCVRHTTDAFPRSGFTSSGELVCRPRVCRGRRCFPAPDPTIRLNLDAR
jgi:hypothetical protein